MDAPKLASDATILVLLGEFDPLQITPRWLRQMDLISAEDYESYQIEIISSQLSVITIGSFQLNIDTDKLQIATEAVADVEAARDLAAGVLLSKGSPALSALGINRNVHFAATQEGYHAVGDTLAPKQIWDDIMHLPGMVNLQIKGARDDGYGGTVNVKTQPSVVIRPGVYVSINDHFNLSHVPSPADRNIPTDPEENDPKRSADKIPVAVKILTEDFSASRDRARAIIDRVASLTTGARIS